MNKYLFALIIPILFSTQTFAQRANSTYGGIQYAMVTYDEDGFQDVEPSALVGRFGKFINDNVSIEGRFGFGLQDDTVTVFDPFLGNVDIDFEVDNLIGVYAVLHSSSQGANDVSFYGVLGYSQAELEGTAFGITVSEDDSGLSYGLGAQISGFNIEYMNYISEDDYDATAISFGYVAEF